MTKKAKQKTTNQATQLLNSFKPKAPQNPISSQQLPNEGDETRIFMPYARYLGENILVFGEDDKEIYIDTNQIVKNFAVYKNDPKSTIELMTFSDGSTTIISEFCDDKFVPATEHEFLSETESQNIIHPDNEISD